MVRESVCLQRVYQPHWLYLYILPQLGKQRQWDLEMWFHAIKAAHDG